MGLEGTVEKATRSNHGFDHMASRRIQRAGLVVIVLLCCCAGALGERDLYEVLGVARDATPRQIKVGAAALCAPGLHGLLHRLVVRIDTAREMAGARRPHHTD